MKKLLAIIAIIGLITLFTPRAEAVTLTTGQGGTGTSIAPTYGQLLLGNALGGYNLVSTSSLGITSWTSAINGGGYALTNAGTITATNFVATSTTATSTFAGDIVASSSYATFNGLGLNTPTSLKLEYPNERIIETFQTGHGWTKTDAGGTLSDDTSVYVVGTQSIKLTSSGTGARTNARKTSISPTIDLSNRFIRMFINVSDGSKVTSSSFYASSDSFTNYVNCDLGKYMRSNGVTEVNTWTPITFDLQDTSACTRTGTPNFAAITSFQFTLTDASAAVTLNVNKLSSFVKPNRGIVSLTFDDGWASQYSAAKAYMSSSSIPGTAYIIPSAIGTTNYMTLSQVKELQDIHGWEIGGHNTEDLTTLSTTTLEALILRTKNYLLKNGLTADDYAYPLGKYDEYTILPLIKKYYRSARAVHTAIETISPYDPYKLRVISLDQSVATTTLTAYVQQAYDNKEWLIFMVHQVIPSPGANDVSVTKFNAVIDKIVSTDIDTKTIGEVLNSGNKLKVDSRNELTYIPGNLGIGTTSPYAKLSVVGEIVSSYFTATSTTATSTFKNVEMSRLNILSGSYGLMVQGHQIADNASGGLMFRTSGTTNAFSYNSTTFTSYFPITAPVVEVRGTSGSLLNLLVVATSSGQSLFQIDRKGHTSASLSTPVLSTCGTSPTISGNDKWGVVTGGTGATACTITFYATYTNVPACNVTMQGGIAYSYTVSTSNIVVTSATLGTGKLNYICNGINE